MPEQKPLSKKKIHGVSCVSTGKSMLEFVTTGRLCTNDCLVMQDVDSNYSSSSGSSGSAHQGPL